MCASFFRCFLDTNIGVGTRLGFRRSIWGKKSKKFEQMMCLFSIGTQDMLFGPENGCRT